MQGELDTDVPSRGLLRAGLLKLVQSLSARWILASRTGPCRRGEAFPTRNAGLMRTNRTLIQSVRILDQTRWFVMAAGSVSISFSCPHTPPHLPCPLPTLPPPAAPGPHCGVIRTATLYERGDSRIPAPSLE